MTPDPITLEATCTALDAAKAMRDAGVGDVIVTKDGTMCGIVTDRDITVRAVAEGKGATEVKLGDICSADLTCLSPGDSVADAVSLMREKAVRRLPVVDGGRAVGVVSIGDLAIERDPDSALADISEAPANT
jgi:CBS domain-containing protein